MISTVTKQIILTIKNRAKFFIRFKYISLSLKLVNYTQSPQVDELERCKIKDWKCLSYTFFPLSNVWETQFWLIFLMYEKYSDNLIHRILFYLYVNNPWTYYSKIKNLHDKSCIFSHYKNLKSIFVSSIYDFQSKFPFSRSRGVASEAIRV